MKFPGCTGNSAHPWYVLTLHITNPFSCLQKRLLRRLGWSFLDELNRNELNIWFTTESLKFPGCTELTNCSVAKSSQGRTMPLVGGKHCSEQNIKGNRRSDVSETCMFVDPVVPYVGESSTRRCRNTYFCRSCVSKSREIVQAIVGNQPLAIYFS